MQNSSVLLADEVTAALDAQTAYQAVSDILRLDGITRIIVTHAVVESLLRQYDGISGTIVAVHALPGIRLYTLNAYPYFITPLSCQVLSG